MKGQCLCGDIQIETSETGEVSLCHCSMCRRWGGGPMFAVHDVGTVVFKGVEPIRYPSSEWAERGFCPSCGTHLFYHLLPNDEYALAAGLFQDVNFKLTSEIFIDEKPGYYEFKNETKKMTGQQVFEQFQQQDDY